MSSKSFAGSVRSGAGSVRLGAGAGGAHDLVLDALYERKRDKKTMRVLTVIVYVFCVSLAAIMLSLYYVFFWEPKDAQYAQRKVAQHTVDLQTSTTPMPTCLLPHTGGGGVAVTDSFDLPANVTNGSTNTTTSLQPTIDLASTDSASTYNLPDVNGTDAVRVDNSSVT